MDLVRVNITFTDAPALSDRFFMTDIPRVGEHIRVLVNPTQERVGRVTEVEYYAATDDKLFVNRLRALIKVETVEE